MLFGRYHFYLATEATKVTQNIYDDPSFFAGYGQLARSIHGLGGAPEWPALRQMLPALGGLKVVDLGCGYGWFCRWAREHGAQTVLGVDVSEKMLERASELSHDAAIAYARADLETLNPAASAASHKTVHMAGIIARP